MINKKYQFVSRWRNHVVVLEPKRTKDGDVIEQGKEACFDNFFYQTDDVNDYQKLISGGSFGADYWEYGQPLPATIKKSPVPVIGEVDKRPSEKAAEVALNAVDERFKSLEGMIHETSKAVSLQNGSIQDIAEAVSALSQIINQNAANDTGVGAKPPVKGKKAGKKGNQKPKDEEDESELPEDDTEEGK